MSVSVTKSGFNVREKLKQLQKPIGLKGSELMRSETAQEARDLVSAGRKNLIINGDMRIDQRNNGSSVSISSSGLIYYLDRWQIRSAASSGGSGTSQRILDGNQSKFRITTSSMTGLSYIQQMIESSNIRHLSGREVTVSIYSTHPVTLDVYGYNSSDSETTVVNTVIMKNIGNNRYSHTFNLPSTQIGQSSNSRGILIVFLINGAQSPLSNGTYDFWNAQLEVGKNATEFEHRSYGEELALCERYFQLLTTKNEEFLGVGYVQNSTSVYVVSPFRTTMRTVPTIYDTLNGTVRLRCNTASADTNSNSNPALNASISSQNIAFLSISGFSGLTGGQGCTVRQYLASSGFLGVNAEL